MRLHRNYVAFLFSTLIKAIKYQLLKCWKWCRLWHSQKNFNLISDNSFAVECSKSEPFSTHVIQKKNNNSFFRWTNVEHTTQRWALLRQNNRSNWKADRGQLHRCQIDMRHNETHQCTAKYFPCAIREVWMRKKGEKEMKLIYFFPAAFSEIH